MTEIELAQIITQHHKKVFGWVTKDNEPRCGLFIAGFVVGALKKAGKLTPTDLGMDEKDINVLEQINNKLTEQERAVLNRINDKLYIDSCINPDELSEAISELPTWTEFGLVYSNKEYTK